MESNTVQTNAINADTYSSSASTSTQSVVTNTNDLKVTDTTPNLNAEVQSLKAALDKATKEAAEYKRQLRTKMTDDEAEKAERDAKWAEMEEKVKKLEREKTESAYKAKYLAMPGFDESLAEETAKAMAAGDMDKVFANHQKANANWEKEIKANMVKQDPKPDGAGGSNGNEVPDNVNRAMERGKAKAASISWNNDILNKYTI